MAHFHLYIYINSILQMEELKYEDILPCLYSPVEEYRHSTELLLVPAVIH